MPKGDEKMDIASLSSAQNSVKLWALQAKLELKKQGGVPVSDKESGELSRMNEQLERLRKDNALSQIESRLRCGEELTEQELEYLKREKPELFEEALEIRLERRLHRRMLENGGTKRDVQSCHLHKLSMLLSEAAAIRRSGLDGEKKGEALDRIARRIAGVQQEYFKYLGSSKYARLPADWRGKKGFSPRALPAYGDDILLLFMAQSAYCGRAFSPADIDRLRAAGVSFPPGVVFDLTI